MCRKKSFNVRAGGMYSYHCKYTLVTLNVYVTASWAISLSIGRGDNLSISSIYGLIQNLLQCVWRLTYLPHQRHVLECKTPNYMLQLL